MSRRAASFAAYGLLGMPLAMAALPVYIQVPIYYTSQLGLSLSLTGFVLFAARIVDTVQDPWIGLWVDRLARRSRLGRALWVACLVLIIAFAGLWLAPVSGPLLAAWLAFALIIVYTAHSVLNIAYLAWGARLAPDTVGLTKAAGWREAFGLAGVVLASTLPAWLVNAADRSSQQSMGAYSIAFALLLALGVTALLHRAPPWLHAQLAENSASWRVCLANQPVRRLLPPYFLNALSVSVPATLALFFIADVLVEPHWSGYFLGTYFLAGAAGMPVWMKLATRLGPARAWRLGMILAIITFVWAATLGPGDRYPYLAICVLAGLSLGADLVLPPVLLARLIPDRQAPAAYYGLWSLLGKLALALSGLALPWLAILDYQPGEIGSGGHALAWTYGGLPCFLKLLALWRLRNFHDSNGEQTT
ncbi:MFS transporter [Paracandidimonas soli]|uniref:Na+/melibiose symporter-like transporter n=1 Tax=Paracandidimonas soli TaxID=1917182 RepID=A0A4V2VRL0_9BURK|nr:MFS transporter [Paracandidimonas soli]TCU98939.1 Na+/melibiose symporter-like transporter [Paracandidimonas soli]